MTLAALVARWRTEAEVLARRGAPAQAEALHRCADELEAAAQEAALEALDLDRAAAESGYSKSQLRRRFPGQRTIRRADLPRKPGRGAADPDLAGALLAAAPPPGAPR